MVLRLEESQLPTRLAENAVTLSRIDAQSGCNVARLYRCTHYQMAHTLRVFRPTADPGILPDSHSFRRPNGTDLSWKWLVG